MYARKCWVELQPTWVVKNMLQPAVASSARARKRCLKAVKWSNHEKPAECGSGDNLLLPQITSCKPTLFDTFAATMIYCFNKYALFHFPVELRACDFSLRGQICSSEVPASSNAVLFCSVELHRSGFSFWKKWTCATWGKWEANNHSTGIPQPKYLHRGRWQIAYPRQWKSIIKWRLPHPLQFFNVCQLGDSAFPSPSNYQILWNAVARLFNGGLNSGLS